MEDLSNDNIIHVKKDGIEYIQFKRLLQYPEIAHCYTLRKDRISFSRSKDDHVLEDSYNKVSESLNLNKQNIVHPYQEHTDIIENVKDTKKILYNTDGVITDKKDIVLCTTSADCTSLIFYDPIKKVIANVHSGWRGTVQKIGQKTVRKLIEEYNCNSEDIICCICPHIRKCHFEVQDDVIQIFKKEFEYLKIDDKMIQKGNVIENVQKYYIDTTIINILMLKEMGLKEENIIDSGICTVCNVDDFHSYRVDRNDSGRSAAIIAMK